MTITDNDRKILEAIQQNAKMPVIEISKKTGIPPTTVHNRIKAMEKEGVIKGYRAVVDEKKLGFGVRALIEMKVNVRNEGAVEHFKKTLLGNPNVITLYSASGTTDAIALVAGADMEEINRIVMKIRTEPIMVETETKFILETFAENKPYPTRL